MMGIKIDETGNRYGRLVVIEEYTGPKTRADAYWNCRCDCGGQTKATGYDLRRGHTNSCGCYHKDRVVDTNSTVKVKHNMSKHNAYKAFISRRRQLKHCTPDKVNWDKVFLYYKISHYLGKDWQVDHIVPVTKGGQHCPENLQIITKTENLKKGNKLDYQPAVYFRL